MKKAYKEYYKASDKRIEYVKPEKGIYIYAKGKGGPGGEEFQECISLLYKMSYKLRMSYKSTPPKGWEKYVVAPLEGIWTTDDNKPFDNKNKSILNFKLMIRQPIFFTKSVFNKYINELSKEIDYSKVEYEIFDEGDCIQTLHIGSFDSEPETQARMFQLLEDDGYDYHPESHHEIYLSDFRKTEPEKLKTILRYKIKK